MPKPWLGPLLKVIVRCCIGLWILPDISSYLLLLPCPYVLLRILIYLISVVESRKFPCEDWVALFFSLLVRGCLLIGVGAAILLPLVLKLAYIVLLYKLQVSLIDLESVGVRCAAANSLPQFSNPLESRTLELGCRLYAQFFSTRSICITRNHSLWFWVLPLQLFVIHIISKWKYFIWYLTSRLFES